MSDSLACQYVAAGLWEMAAAPPTALDAFEAQLLAQLRETTSFDFDNYVDPRDAYYDNETGEPWLPLGTDATDATYPSFRTDEELRIARQECRQLAMHNEFAINGHENRISYIVGTGHKYQAVARKGVKVGAESLAAINRELEDFCRRNRWPQRQQEILRRFDRDGEVFLRFFERRVDESSPIRGYSYADGDKALSLPGVTGTTLLVRFVEPGQIKQPINALADPTNSLGIKTDPEDVETVVGYWIDGGLVEAGEIQHRKANVDCNVKRGVPLFYPVRKNLKRAEKLLRNITTTASLQAAIGLIRKHKNVAGSTIRTFVNAAADVTVSNRDAGTTTRHKAYQPGSILDTSANTEYDFPAAGVNVERFVAGVQAELRAIAARLVMPEFMFTSDASNANYASTLAAEGPADKMFQREQATQEAYDLEIIERVLDLAAANGRLEDDWRGLVKIEVHKPRVQVRDEAVEATVNNTEKSAGILSPNVVFAEGLDYEQEQENIKVHREKYGDNDLDPNAVMAATMKAVQPPANGTSAKEALIATLASCESPVEFLSALTEHCGANAPGAAGSRRTIPARPVALKNDVTSSEAFKRWFGDSKVVDESGKPKVVYHGTSAEFSEFKATAGGEFGPGIYLTDNPQEASEYSGTHSGGQSVVPLYASIQNPFVGSAEEFYAAFPAAGDDEKSVAAAISAGHDGIIVRRERMKYDNLSRKIVKLGGFDTHYIAFSPTQIKSATGNRGTFNPDNPDVRESIGR